MLITCVKVLTETKKIADEEAWNLGRQSVDFWGQNELKFTCMHMYFQKNFYNKIKFFNIFFWQNSGAR